MRVVLIRIGVDKGAGEIHGPLFKDGTFEYIPIPDRFRGTGVDTRTYGTTKGKKGIPLIEYFPSRLRDKYRNQPIHFDPEFETFTYGDPNMLKARLRFLEKGDLLVFYAGLEGWDFNRDPALYIIGFFSVLCADLATSFSQLVRREHFSKNFHVRHRVVFEDQQGRLVLVKGDSAKSRLLQKAVLISCPGEDCNGRPIHILSPDMQKIFGDFHGRTSIQRSPPRWVLPESVRTAADFVTSLR